MLRDIPEQVVDNIAMAVLPSEDESGKREWGVYLINMKETPIKNVLIASKGYGKHKGEDVVTSTLRHFFELISPREFVKVEPIIENLFGLNNEYWVSFYIGNEIFERKFLFLPETINEEYFSTVPLIDKPGVVIR
ncbi:MAG: hypothetical protein IT241_01060 [Bacteroidia bacterium]|nr:hypothetical protein [Bacteroidia bacterium]